MVYLYANEILFQLKKMEYNQSSLDNSVLCSQSVDFIFNPEPQTRLQCQFFCCSFLHTFGH